jgi:hypothetical protein
MGDKKDDPEYMLEILLTHKSQRQSRSIFLHSSRSHETASSRFLMAHLTTLHSSPTATNCYKNYASALVTRE